MLKSEAKIAKISGVILFETKEICIQSIYSNNYTPIFTYVSKKLNEPNEDVITPHILTNHRHILNTLILE